MSATIRIEGQQQAIAKLRKLGQLGKFKGALWAAGLHLKGKVDQYPPATEANSPSSGRWYERGYGPRWRTRSGIHGRKTSEKLGSKWTIGRLNGGMTVVVGNNVSYAPYVQDREKQARAHKAHGWLTTDDVVEREKAAVVRFVRDAIRDALR